MKKDSVAMLFLCLLCAFLPFLGCVESHKPSNLDDLSVTFKGDSQIEVGGPFVGVEMHHGSPLLNRVSFFYPVANSIDLSADYWQRDRTCVLFLGVRTSSGPVEWLGLNPLAYRLTPFSVDFFASDSVKSLNISYRFCETKPAMVATYKITNRLSQNETFEFYTHLETSLRTCHTYALKDRARTEIDSTTATVFFSYDDPQTGQAALFVANAGARPCIGESRRVTSLLAPREKRAADDIMEFTNSLASIISIPPAYANPQRPVASFLYQKNLSPGETLRIVQIIGSSKKDEARELATYLRNHYEDEVQRYEQRVLSKISEAELCTGDAILDHSAKWSKAILAANRHYLNEAIVPMPCPAEYNFYFTHDALMTDLAAVYFDPVRVKSDLEYIAAHVRADSVIPHAYYWKDSTYITEYTGADNWNHFWWVLDAARYLRHSGDAAALAKLFPLLAKSLQLIQQNIKDGLMWANQPDWWDIGKNYGPRAYMTILAIRALREVVYVANVLKRPADELQPMETLAAEMQRQLVKRLWDSEVSYLINFNENGKEKDAHYYIGSLLAAHFDLLDSDKKAALMHTATEKLLDERLGIYNVYPADFHLLKEYYRFHGNEAGDPFVYANGGIWPHGNAWYALGLMAVGNDSAALRFIRNTMTVQGIMNSPNGQPALYEYRNANPENWESYGRVDKPQFLWAGGWYLYCLYQLLGVRENVWNLSFAPTHLEGESTRRFHLSAGGSNLTVDVRGTGEYIKQISYDGEAYPSAVVPERMSNAAKVEIDLGPPRRPYLASTDARLNSARYDSNRKTLILILHAFPGHENHTEIVSPLMPAALFLNGEEVREGLEYRPKAGAFFIEIKFHHRAEMDSLTVQFN